MIIEIPKIVYEKENTDELLYAKAEEIDKRNNGNKTKITSECIRALFNADIQPLKVEIEKIWNTYYVNSPHFKTKIDMNDQKQAKAEKKALLHLGLLKAVETYIYLLSSKENTKSEIEIIYTLVEALSSEKTSEIEKELKEIKNLFLIEDEKKVENQTLCLIPNTFSFQILNTANEKTRRTRQKNKPSGLEGLRKYAEELNTDSRNKAIVMHRGTGTTQQAKIELQRNEAVMTITYEIDKFLKNANESTQKIFYFLLCKMIHHYDAKTGKLSTNTIEFRIDELIEVGIYKIQQSAYKGFDETMKALESIRVDYKNTVTRRGRKPAYSDFGGGHIFARHDKKGGTAFVVLGDSDQWELKKNFSFLFAQYTILPEYAFKLSQKSFNLLSYVYARARQNSDEIHFDTLIQKLNLLNPEETKNITRDIIEPIDKAITEIEDICDGKIKFELIIDENLKLSEQIKKGYLKIYLNEDENQRFKNIAHKRQKLQNKAKKTNTEKKKKQ